LNPAQQSPAPPRPVVINYPQPTQANAAEQQGEIAYGGQQPVGGGFPRFAAGEEEPEQPAHREAAPRRGAPVSVGLRVSSARGSPQNRAGPVAERQEPHGGPQAPPAEPQAGHQAPAAEPQQENEPLEEVPENLELLEPAEEPTAEGSAAPESAREPSPNAESATPRPDDVRKELRQYLDGVKGKLGETAPAPTGPADLLDYLQKLSDYLPERERQRFMGSDVRLAVESLKSKLAGKKGLRRAVTEQFHPAALGRQEPLTRPLVVDTFSYLKGLSAWHPDKVVGDVMRQRIESLVARMRGVK